MKHLIVGDDIQLLTPLAKEAYEYHLDSGRKASTEYQNVLLSIRKVTHIEPGSLRVA